MALASNNPVFARSEPLRHSVGSRPPGIGTPSPQDVADIYATPQRMTSEDVVVKTALLLGIVLVTGAAAWLLDAGPGIVLLAGLGGFVLALVNIFKRQVSPALVLAYAGFEGVFLGAVSRAYETAFAGGITVQAAVGTAAVFGAVLVGYRSGHLRATPRFTRMVTAAFVGLFALVVVNLLVSLIGGGDGLGLRSGGPVAILFSLAFIVVGSLTFVLDFDQADRMVRAGVDQRESWRVAFGLVVGLVWLYLEVLRLLSYLQGGRR